MPAFVIGIGGGSASGKSTIAQEIKTRLAPLRVEIINQDKYFLPNDRLPRHANRDAGKEWPDHNHPDSFDLPRLRADLRAARDHAADVLIAEGILILHDDEVRSLMDLKLYVDTPDDIRFIRRLKRDITERGRTMESVITQYLDVVRPGPFEFIEPTKAYADLIIPEGGSTEKALEVLTSFMQVIQ